MGGLWELVKTLTAIAILSGISWTAYSVWNSSPTGTDEAVPGAAFNCRKAMADHTTGYTCMNSDSCSMTDGEIANLKKLEASINQYCD